MSSMSRSDEIVTCPGWTVVDIGEHLGLIHRWAEELVRLRLRLRADRPPFASSFEDRESVTPDWIRTGGAELVATLRSADPAEEMWAWGLDQHVRFWSRRQLHETLVHRMDLEISAQIEPNVDPAVAVDAVDEFLSNTEKVAAHSPELAQLRGHGERLVFRVVESPTAWSITFAEDGFQVTKGDGTGEVEVTGPAKELLLVLVRRRPWREKQRSKSPATINSPRFSWIAHSAFDQPLARPVDLTSR